jgi:hypothetical protein
LTSPPDPLTSTRRRNRHGNSNHIPDSTSIEGDSIEIRTARPRYRLADLLAQITPGNNPESIDVAPVGEEAL